MVEPPRYQPPPRPRLPHSAATVPYATGPTAPQQELGWLPQPPRKVPRVAALGIWLVALAGLSAVIGLAGLASAPDKVTVSRGLDGGFNIFEQEGPWGTFRDFAGWAASVLGLVWCYKLAARARALSLDGRPSPGWALGSWFIPVAHVVLPFIPLHAAWKRLGGKSGVFVAWAVLWGTSLFLVYVTVGAAVRFGYNALEHQAVGTTVTYDVPRDLVTLAYLHAAVTTGAAIALGMMVMETRRMERQTAVQPAKAPPPAGPPQPPVR